MNKVKKGAGGVSIFNLLQQMEGIKKDLIFSTKIGALQEVVTKLDEELSKSLVINGNKEIDVDAVGLAVSDGMVALLGIMDLVGVDSNKCALLSTKRWIKNNPDEYAKNKAEIDNLMDGFNDEY